MTATEIVARYNHLDVLLSAVTPADTFPTTMRADFWQAAKLGAQAEAELAAARAEIASLSKELDRCVDHSDEPHYSYRG